MKLSLPIILFLALAGAACTPASTPEEPIDLDAAKAALLETDRAWSEAYQSAEDPAETFVTQVAENVRFLPPEAPRADGKEAVRGVIEQLVSMPGMAIKWEPVLAEVSKDADLGYTIGTYHMTFEGEGGVPMAVDGKYLTVWRKDAAGSWKVEADTFNPDGKPTASGQES